MKELRAERSLRVLFAFDPRRTAILLIGGDKSPDDPRSPNWNRWYDQYVPTAAVSQIEHGEIGLSLGLLRQIVAQLGGQVETTAVFEDRRVLLEA